MDKNKIYKAVFDVIEESTEWGTGCENSTYGNWVDGVVTLANNLISENDEGESVNE